jgi:hypothetical protein
MKAIVRMDGKLVGGFSGANEAEVLDAACKDHGVATNREFAGFDDLCAKLNKTRDDFKVEKIAEA